MDNSCCHLDGNTDAAEFCPQDSFNHVLAVATYTLQEGNQPSRSGSISLFSANADVGLELLHHVQTAGVFDIKWNPNAACLQPVLAQADADGCLSLYNLQSSTGTEAHGIALKEICNENISSAMCLCVDWSPNAQFIALGLSDGSVSTVMIREAELQISQSWLAHEYEVWSTSFDTHQPQLLYTGSDDCRFNCWDLRENPSNSVFQNAKSHKMGVCCIEQSPFSPYMVLTGSYDEFLRVWDVRSISKPINEKSICLGGGVWRIKHHPHISGLVLAACMHNGFAIVKIGEEDAVVVETYKKHESLAYGADWQRGGQDGSGKDSLVATCSFYDRNLRLWQPESLMDTNSAP